MVLLWDNEPYYRVKHWSLWYHFVKPLIFMVPFCRAFGFVMEHAARHHSARNYRRYTGFNVNSARPQFSCSPSNVEKAISNQRSSNPGRMHDCRGSEALCNAPRPLLCISSYNHNAAVSNSSFKWRHLLKCMGDVHDNKETIRLGCGTV